MTLILSSLNFVSNVHITLKFDSKPFFGASSKKCCQDLAWGCGPITGHGSVEVTFNVRKYMWSIFFIFFFWVKNGSEQIFVSWYFCWAPYKIWSRSNHTKLCFISESNWLLNTSPKVTKFILFQCMNYVKTNWKKRTFLCEAKS